MGPRNSMRRSFALHLATLGITLCSAVAATAQGSAELTIPQILDRAAAQRKAYIAEFKDLLSQETKVFEVYDKKGREKAKRNVVSTFIVYQSPKDGAIGEFRNVISVDGRPVENADKRAEDFFTEIANSAGSRSEWERIEKEGSRFDESLTINGSTLFQAVILEDNLRPSFDFSLEAAQKIGSHSVYVVAYTQARENRYISMDPDNMVSDGKAELGYDLELSKSSTATVSGKLWIDAQTFQIRREERRVMVRIDGSVPMLATESVLEYDDSPFSILTPRQISFTHFRFKKQDRALKEIVIRFSYQPFTRPDVEVKGAEIKN